MDTGNLTGGFKPLVDALVQRKLLVDDSPRWYSGWYQQQRSNDGKDRIEILLEEELV